ncbi:MAG: hypothetical protein PCFJNLEI_01359 [Verrucomicrobiae bacterium]|nr:hypothetical protein [Verrucomicrobiae bacterium]
MILHIPHASRKIPAEVRNQFLLTDAELEQELLRMTDAYTDELFCGSLTTPDTTVVFPVSRLVLDPERFLDDDAEPMAKRGMGAVYMKTHAGRPLRRKITPQEKASLLDAYYIPHHKRLTEMVDAELNKAGVALVLDCHSFASAALPYELDQSSVRPQICIGTDDFHTPSDIADLLIQCFRAEGLTVETNRPFAGSIVPMKHYRQNPHVISVMIELNRSLYMDEENGAKSGGFKNTQKFISKAVDCLRNLQEALPKS